MSTDDEQRAWELEMEMAIEGRGRTRSRSILATHTSEDADDGDDSRIEGWRGSRRALEPLDISSDDTNTRAKSSSMERPHHVDVVDGGHDPNWLNSPASTDGETVMRGRARSFTAKRVMEGDSPMAHDADAMILDPSGLMIRRRSRSFTSRNERGAGYDDDEHENDDEEGKSAARETEEMVKRAASLSKIYLVGSAPVDVSKLQDESKIIGGKKVEVVEPTGALSTQALDALSEGLQSLSVVENNTMGGVSAGGLLLPVGPTQGESALLSEAELEERKMAEEEEKKLKSQKQSTRRTLSAKASFFKAKVFKTATKAAGMGAGSSSGSGGGSNSTSGAAAAGASSKSGGAVASPPLSSTASGSATPSQTAPTSTGASSAATGSASGATPSPAAPIKRHKLKLLLLGDSGVGKTSLMRVFSGDAFSESMLATAGVDFKLRHIAVGDEEIALQIWDTAGQERFHRITATYYKGANGIVLVYDVTDKKSFDNVGYWMNNIRQYASPNMPAMLLVGNKIDLPSRTVMTEDGASTAKQYEVRYIETSAKTSENTNGALETIARDAFLMSLNPNVTQKSLMEKEKSMLGRRNKDNCVIS